MQTNKQELYLAAGCFWGVQYYLNKLNGVINTEVGYCGGTTHEPTYKEVCNGQTGHVEVVKVIYETSQLKTKDLLQYFFEIHDFCQTNGQGPDIGSQYVSVIFYCNEQQHQEAKNIIQLLQKMNYKVATQLKKFNNFWCAEDYHQEYYLKNNQQPYCHSRKKIFSQELY